MGTWLEGKGQAVCLEGDLSSLTYPEGKAIIIHSSQLPPSSLPAALDGCLWSVQGWTQVHSFNTVANEAPTITLCKGKGLPHPHHSFPVPGKPKAAKEQRLYKRILPVGL